MRLPEPRLTLARCFFVATLACCSSVSAGDKPLSGDLAKLQGTWQAKTGPNGDVTADLEVRGTRAVARLTQGGRELITVRGSIALDEKAKPMTFDLVPDGEKESMYPAIYKFEGGTFTICTGSRPTGRPKQFLAGDQGVPAIKVYKRVQAKNEKS